MQLTNRRSKNEPTPSVVDRNQLGIALVTVLTIVAIIGVLVVTLSLIAISERRATSSSVTINQTSQVADAVSERARLTLVNILQNTNYNVKGFLSRLRSNNSVVLRNGTSLQVKGIDNAVTIDGVVGSWRVGNISPAGSSYGWIEVVAQAQTNQGVQLVSRRISFGESSVFDLALLTETVNCMFCHLQVNGDVGALKHLRPGWGHERAGVRPAQGWEDGWNAGNDHGGSRINGNVFAAGTVTQDGDIHQLNGTQVTGVIEANSRSEALPGDSDNDGVPDFPPILREVASSNATGTLSVSGSSKLYVIPRGNSFSTNSVQSNINGTYDGSIVLVGTQANPIVLNEDIYVSGDVVIKGYVTGKGAIYAGRNLYVAGDVITANPPDKPGKGICATITKDDTVTTDDDACAKLNVQAGKDEFRAAARGNIVIGDYTEKNANNADLPWYRQQSADFYKTQFELWGQERYYQEGTGDELKKTCVGSTCTYKNVEGKVINSGDVKTTNEDYKYSLRPGFVGGDGAFTPWLTDGQYQSILGEETMTYGVWRKDIGSSASASDIKNQLTAAINSNGDQNIDAASLEAAVVKTNGGYRSITSTRTSQVQTGTEKVCTKKPKRCTDVPVYTTTTTVVELAKVFWENDTIRVINLTDTKFETQVNRVDAYLYANQRIAGKIFSQAAAINGGMAAKEIGVLAPGRAQGWPWNDLRDTIMIGDQGCETEGATYYVADTEQCALTINYDYRLRNGGYGFNQVKGIVGQTLSWNVTGTGY
jgi:Tfp pilus assembly protein PilX